ncbi:MAG: DUF5606 domain-containing protein [Bacteroidales bacterium]
MKDLTDVLAVTGKSGLFKLVAQAKSSIIVESLQDGKRFPVYATDAVSSLEEISIFTETEDMPLKEVFKRIYEKNGGEKAPSHKAPPADLKALMQKAVPEYDEDRVYISDIKKIVKWYNYLHEAGMMGFIEEMNKEAEKEMKETEAEKEKEDKEAQKEMKETEAEKEDKEAAKEKDDKSDTRKEE